MPRELLVDDRDESSVGLLVCGGDQAADTGVKWLSAQPGHDAAGCLAQRDAGCEVDAVEELSVG